MGIGTSFDTRTPRRDQAASLIGFIEEAEQLCHLNQEMPNGCSVYEDLQKHVERWLHLWNKANPMIEMADSLDKQHQLYRRRMFFANSNRDLRERLNFFH